MRTFDSNRVVVELSPRDIEALFDDYCSHRGRMDRHDAASVVLAYADHVRVCGLFATLLERMARAWQPVFAQVTADFDLGPCWDDPVTALPEFVRRLDLAGSTLAVVS